MLSFGDPVFLSLPLWVGRADWLLVLGGPITVVYSVLIHTAAGSYVGPKQAP